MNVQASVTVTRCLNESDFRFRSGVTGTTRDGLEDVKAWLTPTRLKLLLSSSLRQFRRMNIHEGSIPFTRSIDNQGLVIKCK